MFLSTVIPSVMLDVEKGVVGADNKFSVPYNFVRGRNLIVNFMPQLFVYGTSATLSAEGVLNNGVAGANRTNIVIPDNVDVHTADITVRHTILNGTAGSNYMFTLQVTFDTVNNIITFVPTAKSIESGTGWANYNQTLTAPVLLVIETII